MFVADQKYEKPKWERVTKEYEEESKGKVKKIPTKLRQIR